MEMKSRTLFNHLTVASYPFTHIHAANTHYRTYSWHSWDDGWFLPYLHINIIFLPTYYSGKHLKNRRKKNWK